MRYLLGIVLDDVKLYRKMNPNVKIIIIAHWGVDFQPIHSMQEYLAKELVLAGANLIIGHGPHTLQPVRSLNGGLIVYSIGNGVFNSNGEFLKHNALPYGAIARLNLLDDTVELIPFYANNLETFWQPRVVDEKDYDKLFDYYHKHLNLSEKRIKYYF